MTTRRSVRVALIRHAPTAWNLAGRVQGQADPPLDPAGRLRAEAWRLPADLAHRAAAGRLGWATSPLARAVETARALGAREPVQVPALAERDYGTWTGRPLAEVTAVDASLDARPPAGETLREVLARARAWLDGLEARPGPDTWIAVTHAGVIRVLVATAVGWDLGEPAPLRLLQDRLHRLRRRGDGHLQLESLNEALEPPSAPDEAPGGPAGP